MTTIVSVRRGNSVVIGGDGQVSLGNTVMKGNARKVRRLYHGKVIAGFAGGTADAFTLFERFEAQLEKHQGHLVRAAVELAKDWRTDRYLRHLEAMMIVADKNETLVITGNGDVLQPEDGIAGIGSGGMYAFAAARALADSDMAAEDIARRAMAIAAERALTVYLNRREIVTLMTLAIFAALIEPASPLELALAFGGAWAMGWHMAWQLSKLDISDSPICLRLFRSNRDAGLIPVLFLAVVILL